MAQYCLLCNNGNPSTANFCMSCGVQLNEELPKCSKCKKEYAVTADFCLHCGYAITDKAKVKQKDAEKIKLRRLNDEIKILNLKSVERQEIYSEEERKLKRFNS